jgi:alpha-N-arabinofuranosidase
MYNTGRETFLMPVRWVDGWPIITEGDQTVPYVARRPRLPPQPPPLIPTSGNFTIRDEFDSPTLPLYWNVIRTPRVATYDLTSTPGSLTLYMRPVGFETTSIPSFVGRRQQHQRATATTALRYTPARDGDKVGLVAFQNEDYYYFLGVTREAGQAMVRLEKHAGPPTSRTGTVVASAPITTRPGVPIYLRIQADADKYEFLYAEQPDAWRTLGGNQDGTILSTTVAKGFVGTMLGLFASAAER